MNTPNPNAVEHDGPMPIDRALRMLAAVLSEEGEARLEAQGIQWGIVPSKHTTTGETGYMIVTSVPKELLDNPALVAMCNAHGLTHLVTPLALVKPKADDWSAWKSMLDEQPSASSTPSPSEN